MIEKYFKHLEQIAKKYSQLYYVKNNEFFVFNKQHKYDFRLIRKLINFAEKYNLEFYINDSKLVMSDKK